MTKNILLLTKNYPPQIGGMEKYSFDLYNRLVAEGNTVKLIAAGPRSENLLARKQISRVSKIIYLFSELYRLIFFAFRCVLEGGFWIIKRKFQGYYVLVWSLDGSIAWLGYLMYCFFGSSTRVTLHGTDVVWPKKIYQMVMPFFWRHTNEIIAISSKTKIEATRRGVSNTCVEVIPHTIDSITYIDAGNFDQKEFLAKYGIVQQNNKVILFSIGRWIERKGFHWFLEEIMPALNPEKFHYILAGFGPYEQLYKQIITEKHLTNVSIVGKVDDLAKAMFYSSSDLFIMPNIDVKGDMEGFGLVLLEAQHYGLFSLISDSLTSKEYFISGISAPLSLEAIRTFKKSLGRK